MLCVVHTLRLSRLRLQRFVRHRPRAARVSRPMRRPARLSRPARLIGVAATLTTAWAVGACSTLTIGPRPTPSEHELLLQQTAAQEAAWNQRGIDD